MGTFWLPGHGGWAAQRTGSQFKAGRGLPIAAVGAAGIQGVLSEEDQTVFLATNLLAGTSRRQLSNAPTTHGAKPLEMAAASFLRWPLLPQPPAFLLLQASFGYTQCLLFPKRLMDLSLH